MPRYRVRVLLPLEFELETRDEDTAYALARLLAQEQAKAGINTDFFQLGNIEKIN